MRVSLAREVTHLTKRIREPCYRVGHDDAPPHHRADARRRIPRRPRAGAVAVVERGAHPRRAVAAPRLARAPAAQPGLRAGRRRGGATEPRSQPLTPPRSKATGSRVVYVDAPDWRTKRGERGCATSHHRRTIVSRCSSKHGSPSRPAWSPGSLHCCREPRQPERHAAVARGRTAHGVAPAPDCLRDLWKEDRHHRRREDDDASGDSRRLGPAADLGIRDAGRALPARIRSRF